MTSLKTKAAARDGGRESTDAHGGDRAPIDDSKLGAGAKGRQPDVRDLRVRAAGHDFILRIDATDPHWRMRALAGLDPLSPEAFAIRVVPLRQAERVEFALWPEAELLRIEGQSA